MTTRNQKVLTQIYPVSSGYIYFILSVYFFKVSWTFHWPFRNSFSESNTHTHTHTHTKTRKVIELPLKLRLWGSHLFYVDLGDWVIACIRVASFVTTSALTDPESHADRALMEFLADPFDVTWAMWILFPASALIHYKYTINGCWSRALCTIEGKVPPIAAVVAVTDTEIAIPEDSQGCIVRCFLENTFLWND